MPAADVTRWFVGSDDSGHEYVVPVDRRNEWYLWCEIPEHDERSWDVPTYAHRIDGGLTFAFPELGGVPIS